MGGVDRPEYPVVLDLFEGELSRLHESFAALTPSQWATSTLLTPPEDGRAPWTMLELAGHLDVAIGITSVLASDPQPGPAGIDSLSFYNFPADAPADFFDYAYTMVDRRSAAEMVEVLRFTFAAATQAARATSPESVSAFPGFDDEPLIRMDDWVSTRVLEAVIHCLDVTDALGRPPAASRAGVTHTAWLMDAVFRQQHQASRPGDLVDDLAWVRAAAGRDYHDDPRLPVIH